MMELMRRTCVAGPLNVKLNSVHYGQRNAEMRIHISNGSLATSRCQMVLRDKNRKK